MHGGRGVMQSFPQARPTLPCLDLSTICHAENLQLCWVVTYHRASCFLSGLLGAPPAMPLLSGPALSTALLQLALQSQSQNQSQGQKVTASYWGQPHQAPFLAHPCMRSYISLCSGEMPGPGGQGMPTYS